MISSSSVFLILSFLVGAGLLVLFLRWRHRIAIEKAREEHYREFERPLEVWVCRQCGFKSLSSVEECTWCGAPKPEEPLSQFIPAREFKAQLERTLPKRFDEKSGAAA